MTDTLMGGISGLTLNTPTFHDVSVSPGVVNFIYGKNGTGKSTVARAIGDAVEWTENTPPGTKVFIYNEQYINQNVQSYGRIPGVYSISGENVKIRQEMEEKTEQLEALEREEKETGAKLSEVKNRIRDEMESNSRAIWRATSEIRTKYPKAIAEFEDDVDGFAAELAKHEPKEDKFDQIRYDYQMGYESRIPTYVFYKKVPYDLFPKCDLMDVPIINRSDSALAVFFRELGNLEWARKGHEAYGHQEKCPYCGQVLPRDFEERFSASIDEQYARQMEEIAAFATHYEQAAEQVKAIITENRQNKFRSLPKPQYPILADAVMEKLEGNLKKIRTKLESPRAEVYLEKMDTCIQQLNRDADSQNAVMKRHSDSLRDIPKARERCREMIWQLMAFECREILGLRKEISGRSHGERETLEEKYQQITENIAGLKRNIEDLSKSVRDTSVAMERINATLNGNGFTGFRFCEKADEKNAYVLVRSGSIEPAQGLSEGERKFVAFLYFYHTVMDSLQPGDEAVPKIVVIDDPVCSMDSENMSFTASLVREMIGTCLGRYRSSETGNTSNILQMFCFTHNPYFFRWISDPFVQNAEHCFYFEISKSRENISRIERCLADENKTGGKLSNRSPVLDEYQMMWKRFAETGEAQELISVSRSILCHYFILTCHFTGRDILRILLDDNRDAFKSVEDGETPAYNIVSSLLSLIDTEMKGPGTGMYFDMGAVEPDRVRFVMKRIFEILKQEQHYNYMLSLCKA
ncbi:MAG: AAA family ATPase [Clostridia bacterium]|nr:AAA family ATPase [Clostridia bacterium]